MDGGAGGQKRKFCRGPGLQFWKGPKRVIYEK